MKDPLINVVGAGNPLENGYIESFNGRLRDKLLNKENFCVLAEVKEKFNS